MGKVFVKINGKPQWVDEATFNTPAPRQEAKAAGRPRAAGRSPTPSPAPSRGSDDPTAQINRANALKQQYTDRKQAFLKSIPLVGGGLAAADRGVGYLNDLASRMTSGATFNQDQRIGAAAYALARGAQGHDVARSYDAGRHNEAQQYEATKQRTGRVGDVAEFGGSMLVPGVGGEAAVGKIAAARAARGAKALNPLLAHAAGGAISGAATGAIEGAARAPDYTDIPNVINQAVTTGAIGGAGGAILGPTVGLIGTGLGKLTRGVGGAISPTLKRTQDIAARKNLLTTAEGQLLGEMADKGIKPSRIENSVADLNSQGSAPILADTSEFAQGRLRALTDKGTIGTDTARLNLTDRATGRAGRLRQMIGNIAGVDPFYMSKIDQAVRGAARKAMAAKDYKIGGIMEGAVKLPPSAQAIIDKKVKPAGPAEDLFHDIYQEAKNKLGLNTDLTGMLMKGNKPTRRVINEMLKIYSERANKAFESGDGTLGAGIKTAFNAFRQQVAQNNPRMATAIAKQAKEFAWERASKNAETIATQENITKYPELILNHLSDLAQKGDPDELAAAKSAILGKVLANVGRDKNSTYMQDLARRISDTQQPAHANLFNELTGGNADNIRKFINNERMPVATDQRLLGSQSSGNLARISELENTASMSGNIGRAIAGGLTKKPAMALSGIIGTVAPGLKRAAQNAEEKNQAAQLQVLMRRMQPGTLSRMQNRVAAQRVARSKLRAARSAIGGGLAGVAAGDMTQQDQQ